MWLVPVLFGVVLSIVSGENFGRRAATTKFQCVPHSKEWHHLYDIECLEQWWKFYLQKRLEKKIAKVPRSSRVLPNLNTLKRILHDLSTILGRKHRTSVNCFRERHMTRSICMKFWTRMEQLYPMVTIPAAVDKVWNRDRKPKMSKTCRDCEKQNQVHAPWGCDLNAVTNSTEANYEKQLKCVEYFAKQQFECTEQCSYAADIVEPLFVPIAELLHQKCQGRLETAALLGEKTHEALVKALSIYEIDVVRGIVEQWEEHDLAVEAYREFSKWIHDDKHVQQADDLFGVAQQKELEWWKLILTILEVRLTIASILYWENEATSYFGEQNQTIHDAVIAFQSKPSFPSNTTRQIFHELYHRIDMWKREIQCLNQQCFDMDRMDMGYEAECDDLCTFPQCDEIEAMESKVSTLLIDVDQLNDQIELSIWQLCWYNLYHLLVFQWEKLSLG